MYIYSKELSFVTTRENKKVRVVWITGRWLDQTIPGGLVLRGHIVEGDVVDYPEIYRDGDPHELGVRAFVKAFSTAEQAAARAGEENPGLSGIEPLDYLKPEVLVRDNIVYVIAYRESEAARAAFQFGLRTEEVGLPVAADGSRMWSWSALGKLQEREDATR